MSNSGDSHMASQPVSIAIHARGWRDRRRKQGQRMCPGFARYVADRPPWNASGCKWTWKSL